MHLVATKQIFIKIGNVSFGCESNYAVNWCECSGVYIGNWALSMI